MDNPIEAWPRSLYEESSFTPRPLFGVRALYVTQPDEISRVLLDEADGFPKDKFQQRMLKPAFGDGLLTASGAHWRWQRRAAAPAFRHDAIMAMAPQIRAAAEGLAAQWLGQPDGARLDVAAAMTGVTFEVILQTMLSGGEGFDAGAAQTEVERYLNTFGRPTLGDMMGLPGWTRRVLAPGGVVASGRLRASVRAMLALRRARLAAGEAARGDLVDLLLAAEDPQDGRRMTDSEMVDNLLTFIGAGHETTAVALAWSLFLIASHASTAARLDAEIVEVLGATPVTAETVGRLTFTRQVVQETMRLFPPLPIMTRVSLHSATLAGQAITAGTLVLIPIYAIHRHAALWDDPEAFDPDRFAPEAAKARSRYAYLPFGAGPRICIGAAFAMTEAVTILATLLRSFRFEVDPDHRIRPLMRLSLRPEGGLPMRVYRR